jgi:hypothetical protein
MVEFTTYLYLFLVKIYKSDKIKPTKEGGGRESWDWKFKDGKKEGWNKKERK